MHAPPEFFEQCRRLREYIGWEPADAERVRLAGPFIEPQFTALIDDFYSEIDRHPEVRRVITGGVEQVARLKQTLRTWLAEFFSGKYDDAYWDRRWRVGWRHVEIGLEAVYTNVALARLRRGMLQALTRNSSSAAIDAPAAARSINMLVDLDLAIIEEAYQYEHRARLQRNERLAALGQIAGGIAHELRNPLNVVKTSVYFLLQAKGPSREKISEHLARIERQVNVADSVITTLSEFARMPLPKLRAASVARLLAAVVEANPVPREIELVIDVAPDAPEIWADPDQLLIALGNLVRNARDAMASGGRLTLAARREADLMHLEVRDTGTGISPEVLARIREPLYSTKARGLGLGLAITRSIFEKHQAKWSLESSPGRGTTVHVNLLIADPTQASASS